MLFGLEENITDSSMCSVVHVPGGCGGCATNNCEVDGVHCVEHTMHVYVLFTTKATASAWTFASPIASWQFELS